MSAALEKHIQAFKRLGLLDKTFEPNDVHHITGHMVVRFDPPQERITVNKLSSGGVYGVELPIVYEYVGGEHKFYSDMVDADLVCQVFDRLQANLNSMFALPYRIRNNDTNEVLRDASDQFVAKLGFTGALDVPKVKLDDDPQIDAALREEIERLRTLPVFQGEQVVHSLSELNVMAQEYGRFLWVHTKDDTTPDALHRQHLARIWLGEFNVALEYYVDNKQFDGSQLLEVLNELADFLLASTAKPETESEDELPEDHIDSSFLTQMKDGHYMPKPDEPSPFGDGRAWVYWKQHHDPRNALEATFNSLRHQLMAILRKEKFRSMAHLENVYSELKTSYGHLSLGYVIHIRWVSNVPYERAHQYSQDLLSKQQPPADNV